MGLFRKSDDGKVEVEVGEGRLSRIRRGLGSGDTNVANPQPLKACSVKGCNKLHCSHYVAGGD